MKELKEVVEAENVCAGPLTGKACLIGADGRGKVGACGSEVSDLGAGHSIVDIGKGGAAADAEKGLILVRADARERGVGTNIASGRESTNEGVRSARESPSRGTVT